MADPFHLKDFLFAQQSTVNHTLFSQRFGIFLDNEKESKVSVFYRNNSASLEPLSCDKRSEHGFIDINSTAWQRNQLKNVKNVQAFFSQHCPGLALFHIGQAHSRSRIDMTREVFDELVENIGIFSAIKDAVIYFGIRSAELEIAPPRPRYNVFHDMGSNQHRDFEIVYGLRFIELNHRNGGNPWSMRQCVVYNQTSYARNSSHWLLFSLPEVMSNELKSFFSLRDEEVKSHPFEVHVILITLAVQMWRPYLVWAVEMADSYRRQVCMADERGQSQFKLDGSLSQIISNFEDAINDANLAVKATIDVVDSLLHLYSTIEKQEQSVSCDARSQFLDFTQSTLVEKRKDLEMLDCQTAALLKKLKTTSDVVTSFLSLANGHSIHQLSVQGGLETNAIKALSVVTLIYLPTTVVLNFFSASFIDASSGTMRLVGKWWLFAVVGIPLTIFTLVAWGVWNRRSNIRSSPSKWKFIVKATQRNRSTAHHREADLEKADEESCAKSR